MIELLALGLTARWLEGIGPYRIESFPDDGGWCVTVKVQGVEGIGRDLVAAVRDAREKISQIQAVVA